MYIYIVAPFDLSAACLFFGGLCIFAWWNENKGSDSTPTSTPSTTTGAAACSANQNIEVAESNDDVSLTLLDKDENQASSDSATATTAESQGGLSFFKNIRVAYNAMLNGMYTDVLCMCESYCMVLYLQ